MLFSKTQNINTKYKKSKGKEKRKERKKREKKREKKENLRSFAGESHLQSDQLKCESANSVNRTQKKEKKRREERG